MRRKDREMSKAFALSVADRCEYAVLSMTDMQHNPYCVPISIVRAGDVIYFHCAAKGEKLICLRANPQVCLACVGDTRRMPNAFTTEYESAIIRGTVSEVIDVQEKTRHFGFCVNGILRPICRILHRKRRTVLHALPCGKSK